MKELFYYIQKNMVRVMTEKPVAIVLPTWDPDEPRFVVMDCPNCSDDRQFKNNKCVFNQRLGFAYSVEELVALLNVLNNEIDELKNDNARLEEQLNYIQDSITEKIKHQKIKISENALKEVIKDYNEWILGHKGD